MTVCKCLALSAAAALSLLLPATVRAEVTVRFVDAARYADAGVSEAVRARSLATLERHLKATAAPCVAEGERLVLKVLDVDLAGEVDWSRAGAAERRVLREATAPRIELDWQLADRHGQVVAGQREQVSDIDYLRNSARVQFAREPLPYERLMLEDWARSRVCRPPR